MSASEDIRREPPRGIRYIEHEHSPILKEMIELKYVFP
jgi:hypothetical protein